VKKNKQKNSKFKSQNVKCSFTGKLLTKYSGLSAIMSYLNKLGLGQQLDELFPTMMHNATKYSTTKIMLAVVLASLCGINRMTHIASFTFDSLVMFLLGLPSGLNKDVIGVRLKQLGQRGSIHLHEHLFGLTKKWLIDSNLTSITLDADSEVQTVYGHQEGADVGFNPVKRGAKSYHPILAFVSDTKLIVNSWFRTGSAYTSNGICEFIKQTKTILPATIQGVFFRADSGFFNGQLFDLLESYSWTYLVKVKLKNLKVLLNKQQWHLLPDHNNIWITEFEYRGSKWSKSRKLQAVRTIKEWKQVTFLGKTEWVAVYDYACYCSNLDVDAYPLHDLYNQRATSETWIEQVKSQLLAGRTLTDKFHANDLLWQLSVFAYNVSVMMRFKIKKFWREEHATFRGWFIQVPAKILTGGRSIRAALYQEYHLKERWLELEQLILSLQ